ncbi:MAG: TMEM165/GDT1 family protein [Halanaerobiales bacterium]|nr:TMEM165/GDT1 family protein [Halanaerobiales bacterium]
MFWKTLLTTFGLIFLAELGDKTQLATMLLVAQDKSVKAVFFGAALALICSTFLGVTLGAVLNKIIPANYIQMAAGIAFIIIGGLLLFGKV